MKKTLFYTLKTLILIVLSASLYLTKLSPEEIIVLLYLGTIIVFQANHRTTLLFLIILILVKYALLLLGKTDIFFIESTHLLYFAVLAIAQKVNKEGVLTLSIFGFIVILTLFKLDESAERAGIYLYYLLLILAVLYTKPTIIKEWISKTKT